MNGSIKVKANAYDGTNTTASVLRAIGWITIIGGIIAGAVFANQKVLTGSRYTYYETVFNWSIALGVWASAAVSGTLFLGFAEVITLLQTLVNRKEYECDFNGDVLGSTADAAKPSSSNMKTSENVPERKRATPPAGVTVCPSCKTAQSADRDVCWQCGKALKKAVEFKAVDMNNVYASLLDCEKYADLFECWTSNGLDRHEALAEYTQQMKHKAEIERLYGSDQAHVKEYAQNLVAGLRDRCN